MYPPLTTPRGDVYQKPRGTGQIQGWIGSGLAGRRVCQMEKAPEMVTTGNKNVFLYISYGRMYSTFPRLFLPVAKRMLLLALSVTERGYMHYSNLIIPHFQQEPYSTNMNAGSLASL